MTLVDTNKAAEFFQAKLDFTTGPIELSRMIENNENIRIIDVRAPEDYAKEHIPCSANLPGEKWETFDGLEHGKVNIIYCYSQQCHLAAKAALFFAQNGYNVMELEGGFNEWKNYNLPTAK